MKRLAALVILCVHTLAGAVRPDLFPAFPSESLSVEVTIPVPEKPEKVLLQPLLIVPKVAPPWTAIVLPSNCSGLDDRMWHFWVDALHKENIAVILLDSFNPRGFPSVCTNQFLLTTGARLQDVHQVLDHIRADRRFLSDKIALGGHSQGALSAYQSAYAAVLPMLKRPAGSGYNAFVMAAPSCNLIYRSRQLLGPALFIGAEKDDWTPIAPCLSELGKTKEDGQPVELMVVPNAYHTFSTVGVVYSGRVMKYPADAPQVFIKELSYVPKQTRYELVTGEEVGLEEMLRKYAGFLGNKMFGAHVGGSWDAAPDVAAATVRFLKANGW